MAFYTDGVETIQAVQFDGVDYGKLADLSSLVVGSPVERIDSTFIVPGTQTPVSEGNYFVLFVDNTFGVIDAETFESKYQLTD
jgi:hypothetical protein